MFKPFYTTDYIEDNITPCTRPSTIYVNDTFMWVLEPDGKTYILINTKTDTKVASAQYKDTGKEKKVKKRIING